MILVSGAGKMSKSLAFRLNQKIPTYIECAAYVLCVHTHTRTRFWDWYVFVFGGLWLRCSLIAKRYLKHICGVRAIAYKAIRRGPHIQKKNTHRLYIDIWYIFCVKICVAKSTSHPYSPNRYPIADPNSGLFSRPFLCIFFPNPHR